MSPNRFDEYLSKHQFVCKLVNFFLSNLKTFDISILNIRLVMPKVIRRWLFQRRSLALLNFVQMFDILCKLWRLLVPFACSLILIFNPYRLATFFFPSICQMCIENVALFQENIYKNIDWLATNFEFFFHIIDIFKVIKSWKLLQFETILGTTSKNWNS